MQMISEKKLGKILRNAAKDNLINYINKMNEKKISSLLVFQNTDIKKKVKSLVGILHLHHCLNRGIK